jgi:hypothetical protein
MIVRVGLCRAIATTLLVTASLSACTSWQVQTVAPEQVVSTQHPSSVRVQRLDGSRAVVDDPRIGGDSLLGVTVGKPTGVPLADIYQVAVKRVSAGKTVGLVLAIPAGIIILSYVVCAATDCLSGLGN